MAQKKDKKGKETFGSRTPPAFRANEPAGQNPPPENQGHGAVPGSRDPDKNNRKFH